jgi:signal transduction histidine kinase
MLLAGDAGKLKKEQQHYVKEIFDGNQRMIDLVNALLNVSRIELGTFAINPEQVDVVEIAKSMVHELESQIKAKKLEVVEEYAPDLPQILADKKITRILIQNLLTNSVKYTPESGRIMISLSKDEKNYIIKVADNGYGIPDADKPKIFDKLYRAENVREKETDGTGLGLYLVKQIVEQAGGKVWFESEVDKGTTFYINIPLTGMVKKEGTKQLS